MMVELITKYNRHNYESQLEQMFRLRYKIFVEQLGWDLPHAKDGLEIDEFDTEDTIYLIAGDLISGKVPGPASILIAAIQASSESYF